MKIVLLGYMGSGKTLIAKQLSDKLNLKFIDLDFLIKSEKNLSIADLFKKYGEITFRKIEKEVLHDVLTTEDDFVLSTGGGTPIFYDNLQQINKTAHSIYLQASPMVIAERLSKEKHERPLIAHLTDNNLPEFVAKHLFERSPFYQQAKFKVNANQTPKAIVEDIIKSLP